MKPQIKNHSKHKTFVLSRPKGFDVGPTSSKCYTNVLCLMGYTAVENTVKHVKRSIATSEIKSPNLPNNLRKVLGMT